MKPSTFQGLFKKPTEPTKKGNQVEREPKDVAEKINSSPDAFLATILSRRT